MRVPNCVPRTEKIFYIPSPLFHIRFACFRNCPKNSTCSYHFTCSSFCECNVHNKIAYDNNDEHLLNIAVSAMIFNNRFIIVHRIAFNNFTDNS